MIKTCMFCGDTFESRDRRSIACKKPECRKAAQRYRYNNQTQECVCSVCGVTYLATQKQKKDLCPHCAHREKHFKTMEQKVICQQCGKFLGTQIKCQSGHTKNVIASGICDECRQKNKEAVSTRMKLHNPTYTQQFDTMDEYVGAKQRKSELQKIRSQESKERTIRRMKEHNPMHDPEIRARVRQTIKGLYDDGKIVIDGRKFKTYKGDRGIKNYLRLALKEWRKWALQRANYACEKCGRSHTYLHVHHTTSFSQIVDMFVTQYHMDVQHMEYKSDEYQLLERLVVDYHWTHDIAMVLCPTCHELIDPHYYQPKEKIIS